MRLLLAALISLFCVSAAQANCDAGETVIRLGTVTDADFPARNRSIKLLKEAVNRELQGKACVQTLSDQSRFKGTLSITALQNGEVEMAAPGFDTLGSFSTVYRIFDLPFAFKDIYSVERFEAANGVDLASGLNRNGMQALAFWHERFNQMAAKKPLIWPADAGGLKFRADSGATAAEQVAVLNATARSLAENDLSVAIKQGRIDAQISNWEQLRADGTAKLQASVTQTNHDFLGYQLVAAKPWWDGLDPALRKSLLELIVRISRQANFEAVNRESTAMRAVIRSGAVVRTLTQKQRAAWIATMGPVWRSYSKFGHEALIQAARQADLSP